MAQTQQRLSRGGRAPALQHLVGDAPVTAGHTLLPGVFQDGDVENRFSDSVSPKSD